MKRKKLQHYINLIFIAIIILVLGAGILHYWKTNNDKQIVTHTSPQAKLGHERTYLTKEQILQYTKQNHNKVVIIGLDGATWQVILPLVNQGKLPNIKYLMEHGTYGNCKTVTEFPIVSPAVWTSIATGKKQNKHGIEGFLFHLQGEYERLPFTSDLRKVKAIWNILSEYGKTVGTVSWFVTRPPEKVNGFMVSDSYTKKWFTYPVNLANELYGLVLPKNTQSHTTEKSVNKEKQAKAYNDFEDEQVEKEIKRFTTFPYEKNFELRIPFGTPEFVNNFLLRQCIRYQLREIWTIQADTYLYQKYHPDFFATYFPWIDVVSHLSWQYYEPLSLNEIYEVTPQERKWFATLIPKVYEEEDAKIGRILKVIPKDAVVLVVSDHGFQALNVGNLLYRWADLNLLLSELGYLKKNAQGKIDWSQTQAYELEDYFRYKRVCYLNLKGREPQGIIDPKSAEAIRDKIVHDLAELKTTTGKKVFLDVQKAEGGKLIVGQEKYKYMTVFNNLISPYSGDFHATINPELKYTDMMIVRDKQIPVKHFITANPFSGDHYENGIIILSGPPIRKKTIVHNASVLDVTPTVLYLMGLPFAEDMDGKILKDAIDLEYLKQHPVHTIPTYENNIPIQRIIAKDTTEDAETLERFKALGYIGK